MAQYQIPQFIETEAKIVGPFTFKQFIYLASGSVTIFLLQYALSGYVFFVAAFMIAAIALGLAFFRIDGVPLPRYIAMAVSFMFGSKRYIYNTNNKGPALDFEQNQNSPVQKEQS